MKKFLWLFGVIIGIIVILIGSQIRFGIPISQLKVQYANDGSKFIQVMGMNVHYRDQGDGPVVVLVHGTSSSLHTWNAWTDSLKQNFRVIRMDLPGFGLTGPNPSRDYSREDIREDQAWVLGKLTVRIGEHTIVKSQYGSSDVKRSKGKPLSIGDDLKSAASDALKKCASLIGLGLDLSVPIRRKTMQRLHIVGREKCGDDWDKRRKRAIRMLTGGKKTSSKDLLDVEARILIGILEGSDAPIVKEARKKMG